MIKTDIIIIGAGPCGLFTVFEAGLLKLKCHIVDVLAQPGGQLSEVYPKKPIYDIPGFPSILAGDLVTNLMEQIKPFEPGFTLGERVESLERTEEKLFTIKTNHGTEIQAPVIAIAGGLGCFEPKRPPIENIEKYENNGLDYIIRDPEKYRNKKILIAGGGDSALDWSIELANIASEVTLVHRRTSFRGAPESLDKVISLSAHDKFNLVTNAQVIGLDGEDKLEKVLIKTKSEGEFYKEVDHYIPLFGLTPKLGPISDWGLSINRSAIEVNTQDYSTEHPGIYAIGDINTYPGKLKLILCGFHEATLMVQSAFKYIYPEQKLSFKYTTVTGVDGFEKTDK